MVPGRKAPRSGQCGLWCRPLGVSAADAWKVASPIHMGIMHSRYEGSFSSPRPAGSFALMLLPIDSYFS
jgi:hypothetical protein